MNLAQALGRARIDPREARLLLAAATGWSEAAVLAHGERELEGHSERRFLELARRRAAGEPVAYLLGRKEFYGLELEVDRSVLVPRPETELLVELALAACPRSVLDLGTGSGAVALAIKRHLPQARVVAVDASAEALSTAARNAARLGLAVELRYGSWLEPVAGERFELIVANPPYVAADDPHLEALAFEPRQALVAGADGLDAIRAIAASLPGALARDGRVLIEHGLGQEAAVRGLLGAAGLEDIQSWPDLAGIARVTGGRLKSSPWTPNSGSKSR